MENEAFQFSLLLTRFRRRWHSVEKFQAGRNGSWLVAFQKASGDIYSSEYGAGIVGFADIA
jgi:hypothetical protein